MTRRSLWNEVEVARRLPWLLVFRAAIATTLLIITLLLDFTDWRLPRVSSTLYAVAAGIYLVVVILGLLLRHGVHPLVLGSVHLAAAIFTAFLVVGATGGVESGLAFLYFLAILDGAIIGGRKVALAVATGCALVFGGQMVAELYGYAGTRVGDEAVYANAVVSHLAGFYLIALLAGYLGELLRTAREETGVAQSDRDVAELLYEGVLESVPLAVMTVDADYRIRTANPAAATILGRPLALLIGEHVPPALAVLIGSRAPSSEITHEVDGRERLLSVSYARMGPQERTLGVLVIEDRTEMRALERDLQAQERLASLGQLAAGIAHEIRNPLAAISGAVELMRDSQDAASRRSLEDVVGREIVRLNELINDFLSYARPMRPERADVDMSALAREVCALIRQDPRWAARQLEVEAPARVVAHVDAGQMRQVLWNLLRNAVEASPDDTTVNLVVGASEGVVEVTVLDQGPGLSPEVQRHLFEPFRTTKADGTGLGLAMVHRIVEAHDGQISIDNREPRGAAARVRVPAARVGSPA